MDDESHYGRPGQPETPEQSAQSALAQSSYLLQQLHQVTETDFTSWQNRYESFARSALNEVQNSRFSDRLEGLHRSLSDSRVFDKIRAVDAWADGETAYRLVGKSWESVVDKLYRINIEENKTPGMPPQISSILEKAAQVSQIKNDRWVTPGRSPLFIDDLVRTKFVVPFADNVKEVGQKLKEFAIDEKMPYFRRYHAKDSGYHAQHFYVVTRVPMDEKSSTKIAFEIKVLTKLQDTLGELTHGLYEMKRTGRLTPQKKRKLAWEFESADFTASYLGHSAHYIESEMTRLKNVLHIERDAD